MYMVMLCIIYYNTCIFNSVLYTIMCMISINNNNNFHKQHTDGRQAQHTKGQEAEQLQALAADIVCKITQRNNIMRENTCDPALKLLNGVFFYIKKERKKEKKGDLATKKASVRSKK